VELETPQADVGVRFLTGIWGLRDAGRRGNTNYLRATEAFPYVLALTPGDKHLIASVTLEGSAEEIGKVRERAQARGCPVTATRDFDEPGRPSGYYLEGPEGQVYRLVTDREPAQALPAERDRPLQLTHAVLNVTDRVAATQFVQEVLGFRLSDRTRVMSFLRCERTHHSIALADAKVSSLNHLAFEMQSLDSVMRGIGRMQDHGHPQLWGPGRHGPGNNVFSYFAAPFGGIIEYTSEIQRVGEDYRTGAPEDWTWEPNRSDHWGVGGRDAARMSEAEKQFRFKALEGATAMA
jgi:catechol 2,3-dioxygenase-like lactoylglutathione lyase family enzyme